ncbi:unnamed protein product [Kuraishia capsulata CBS 1993]|uniref:NAD(P)H-hydrate epimerase n=1 Tax=Kuraishia capsulata CBS 1993 TaxID=1382522 RepID=W6MFJ7_9ASCO|nr:uncharacterized protein KUCA_T00000560001 [Kuraishia capsulata CBS 1993]CDK24594.1 unnamed protein product [Kuraishia capsulata CBS 1993]
MSYKILASTAAAALDKELMSTGGFSIFQLMELAGLSVAQAVYKCYPPETHPKVLVLAGPGNNGGDGLVAARHLKLFGYNPKVYYPKKSKGELFDGLQTQLKSFGVEFVGDGDEIRLEMQKTDQILDALFGFSFHPPIRAPFNEIVAIMSTTDKPVVSVDIPSGWDVDEGPTGEVENFLPEVLVSLTAPKPCAKLFKGRHFLGGRFVSDELAKKWDISIGKYEGVDQVVELERQT